MSNPFELLRPAPYVSQYVGLPLDETRYALERKNEQYQQNIHDMDQLSMLVNNIKTYEGDKAAPGVLENVRGTLDNTVKQISELDFQEASPEARNILRNSLRKVMGNKELQQVMENRARWEKFDEMRTQMSAQGEVLDWTPRDFSSVSYDEQGNPSYNSLDNPFQQKKDWAGSKGNILKTFLREEILAAGGPQYKDINDLMSKPFIEIAKEVAITPTQLAEKLDSMTDFYMDTGEGRQEVADLIYKGEAANEQEARELVKESLSGIGSMMTYKDREVNYSQNSLFAQYLEGITTDPNKNDGAVASSSLSFVVNENNKSELEEILTTKRSKLDESGRAIQEEIVKHVYTQDPEFRKGFFSDMNTKKTDTSKPWLGKFALSLLSKINPSVSPHAYTAYTSEPERYVEYVFKEHFPEVIENHTHSPEGEGTYIDWFGVRNSLIETTEGEKGNKTTNLTGYTTLMPGSPTTSKVPKISNEDQAKAQEKHDIVETLDASLREAALERYSQRIDEENSTIHTTRRHSIATETPVGRGIQTNVSNIIKQEALQNKIKIKLVDGIDGFTPGKFVPKFETTSIEGLVVLENDIYFEATMAGSYGKDKQKMHKVFIQIDDNDVLSRALSNMPKSIFEDLVGMLPYRGAKYTPGASHYTTRGGDKMPLPEGVTINLSGKFENGVDEYSIYKDGKPLLRGNQPVVGSWDDLSNLLIYANMVNTSESLPESQQSQSTEMPNKSQEEVETPTESRSKSLGINSSRIPNDQEEADNRASAYVDQNRQQRFEATRKKIELLEKELEKRRATKNRKIEAPTEITKAPKIDSVVAEKFKTKVGTVKYSQEKRFEKGYSDCSTAVCAVFDIPNVKGKAVSAEDIYNGPYTTNNKEIEQAELVSTAKEGQIVFMYTGDTKKIDHVGVISVDKETGEKYLLEVSSSHNGSTISPLQQRLDAISAKKLYVADYRNPNR